MFPSLLVRKTNIITLKILSVIVNCEQLTIFGPTEVKLKCSCQYVYSFTGLHSDSLHDFQYVYNTVSVLPSFRRQPEVSSPKIEGTKCKRRFKKF